MPLFMMVLCVCVFSSCSSDDDEDGGSSAIVGTWVENYDYSDYTVVTTFTFNSDGSGVRIERAEYTNGQALTFDPLNFTYTYNEESETIRLKFDNDGTLYTGTASITGKTLVLRYNDTYYTLIKQ